MKKLILPVFAALSVAASAEAAPLSWELPCKWDLSAKPPVGAPRLTARKTSMKLGMKWKTSYSLIVRPMNPNAEAIVLKMVPAGSGDEDYNEYYAVNAQGEKLYHASIQNQFQWVSIEGRGEKQTNWRCLKRD